MTIQTKIFAEALRKKITLKIKEMVLQAIFNAIKIPAELVPSC